MLTSSFNLPHAVALQKVCQEISCLAPVIGAVGRYFHHRKHVKRTLEHTVPVGPRESPLPYVVAFAFCWVLWYRRHPAPHT